MMPISAKNDQTSRGLLQDARYPSLHLWRTRPKRPRWPKPMPDDPARGYPGATFLGTMDRAGIAPVGIGRGVCRKMICHNPINPLTGRSDPLYLRAGTPMRALRIGPSNFWQETGKNAQDGAEGASEEAWAVSGRLVHVERMAKPIPDRAHVSRRVFHRLRGM